MTTLADIKNDLPDWPDDIIDQWLLYLANREDTGWPPPEPLNGHPWTYILGHRPISWWRNVSWQLETTDCSFEALCSGTKRIVNGIFTSLNDDTADEGTRRRYNDAFHYILNNARFPMPPIGMHQSDGLSVIDGNHRVAAFCALQQAPEQKFQELQLQKPSREQEIWIGTHSAGETPLD